MSLERSRNNQINQQHVIAFKNTLQNFIQDAIIALQSFERSVDRMIFIQVESLTNSIRFKEILRRGWTELWRCNHKIPIITNSAVWGMEAVATATYRKMMQIYRSTHFEEITTKFFFPMRKIRRWMVNACFSDNNSRWMWDSHLQFHRQCSQ